MPEVDVGTFEESFVIRFGSEFSQINAYTLASTLVAIADAARAANARVNPGYDIEVVVEALGSGSFKAKVRALYRQSGNLFSAQDLKAIVLSLIAAHIYTQALAPEPDLKVIVNDDSVVVTAGERVVVVPRDIHDSLQEVEGSDAFIDAIRRAFRSVEADTSVESVAITAPDEDEEADKDTPPVEVPRRSFAALAGEIRGPDALTRELEEQTEVQIVRAILEQTRRRWEFVWRGVRIAAPVLDSAFHERFAAHEITIAPGDTLRVRLRILQRLDATGIYVNDRYEVTEVIDHVPRPPQQTL